MSNRKQPPSLKLSLRRPAFLVSGLLLLGCVAGWTTMACNEDLGDGSEEASGADTASATDQPLVLSQVYADLPAADGSQSMAKKGFVELFNRGTDTVKLGGKVLQTFGVPGATARDAGHSSAAGELVLPEHDLEAGQHFLISIGDEIDRDGGALTRPDLAPKASTRFPLYAQGNIVLLDQASDTGPGPRLDSLSYGPDATALEGHSAPALDHGHALARNGDSCQATHDSKADFALQAPAPLTMHQPIKKCASPDAGADASADAAGDASNADAANDASNDAAKSKDATPDQATPDGSTHPANEPNPGEHPGANNNNDGPPDLSGYPPPEEGNEPTAGGHDAGTGKAKPKSGGCSSTPATPNDAGVFGLAVAALALVGARRRNKR